jgi:hypothetical protein
MTDFDPRLTRRSVVVAGAVTCFRPERSLPRRTRHHRPSGPELRLLFGLDAAPAARRLSQQRPGN